LQAFPFEERIKYAREQLEQRHDLIIYEGTGHPGVGSIVGISNARAAQMLDAHVVIVLEGGIGKTIDMLNLCLTFFKSHHVPVIGVILNKVHVEKIEKVRKYVQKYLDEIGLPLLGVIPYDKSLAFPVMRTIAKIEDLVAGSLLDQQDWTKERALLLVTPATRFKESVEKIIKNTEGLELKRAPLAGMVICGQGDLDDKSMDFIRKYKIPLVQTNLDTFGSVIRISNIEVKINRSTPWKVKRAIELIRENVNMDAMLSPL